MSIYKNDNPACYTVPEIAKKLQISKNMAYELVNKPGFPRIHVGRCLRIPAEAFEDWLRKSTKNGMQ